jgi:hypothetical protein
MKEMDRQDVIQELVNDFIDTVEFQLGMGDLSFIDGVFRYGFGSIDDMCNEDLEVMYYEQFGENIKIVDEIF